MLAHHIDPCRPRRVAPGLLVCWGHRARVLRHLSQLAALDQVLAARATGTASPRAGARSSETRIPADPRAAAMRGHIRRKLAGWVVQVVAERHLTKPGEALAHATTELRVHVARQQHLLRQLTDPDVDEPTAQALTAQIYQLNRTIAAMQDRVARLERATDADELVRFLARHHDYLLADPDAADDYADELSELHAEAWRRAYPERLTRVPVGRCPLHTSCDVTTHAEQQCPGTVTGTVRPGDDLLPEELVCSACGSSTPPQGWITLGRQLAGKHTQRWLSAADLAELWTVPIKTVHRWSRWHRWPKDDQRPARYDADKAQQTYDYYRGDRPPGVSRPAALTQVRAVSQDAVSVRVVSDDARCPAR